MAWIALGVLSALAAIAYIESRKAQQNQLAGIGLVSGILNFSDIGPAASSSPITNDPSTWPSGDKIWDICRAIAYAEGYYGATNNPYRLNNPGDISDYASVYGFEEHSGSKVTHFPDAWTGWQKLYEKVNNAATGASSVYKPDMTWVEIAQKWAGDWVNWSNNVTSHLGVPKSSTLADYMNS